MKSNIFLCEIILYNTLISYFINMKSYFIFAIFLTIAYIIYYVVIITQELYGKKKDGKPEEEVFNIDSDEEEEESISVTESDTGFNVGSEQYETEYHDSAANEEAPEPAPPEETAAMRLARMKAKAEERMEETEPYLSDTYSAEDMYKAMVSGGHLENRPTMVWNPLKDKL